MRNRPVYRLVSGLLAIGLLATGCTGPWPTTSQSATGTVAAGEPAIWQPCPELLTELLGDIAPPGLLEQLARRVTFDCATVAVPQDWDRPQSPERFELAVVRARSTRQHDRIGSLLINPGGPGGSGVEAAVFLALGPILGGLPDAVTERFDLVGFDPRGVGRSAPVECLTDEEREESYGADPDPVSREAFDAVVAEVQEQAQRCGAKYGEALGRLSTRQTAHDLEALRQAVGDEKLTYLGYSYGTLLGAVYAQLYPEKIRAMVLDGAVDPQQDLLEASEGQARGFERALDNFNTWCASRLECPLRPSARAAVTEAIERARTAPVPGPDGREATAGWVFLAVVSTLYSQELWPRLANALDELERGNASGVFELADIYTRREPDGGYPNMSDANTAITCLDTPGGVTSEQARQLQEQWRRQYPVFGAPLAVSTLACLGWPVPPDPYPVGPAVGAPPIMVIGTRGDPATPYESTTRLAEMLGVGFVVTWEGEGHTAYPEAQCIADVVNDYLLDLTVPPAGTTCR